MESNLYFTAAGLFTALVLVLCFFILAGLRYALNQSGWSEGRQQKILWGTGLLVLAWLGLLAVLARQNFFTEFSAMPPRFVFAVLPAFLTVAILANVKSINYLLGLIPPGWLVYLQSFRVIMEVILWMLFVAAVIPVQMSLEGRNFDILVGLTAPFAAFYFFGRTPSVRWGIIWNVAGLGLLLNIIVISVLSAPVPFRVFWNEPANTVVAYLPFIWLPGFVVPVALALHVFSLKQLLQTAGKTRQAPLPLQKVRQ